MMTKLAITAECSADDPSVIFLIVTLGIPMIALPILWCCPNICRRCLQIFSRTKCLHEQEQQQFEPTCGAVQEMRTFDNWVCQFPCLPHNAHVNGCKLRQNYEFSVGGLLRFAVISQTVFMTSKVWMKALFLASLSASLVLLANGNEHMDGHLQSIDSMAGNISFLTMLLLTTFLNNNISAWQTSFSQGREILQVMGQIALMIGSDTSASDCASDDEELVGERKDTRREGLKQQHKRLCWDIYRYLVMVQLFTYRELCPDDPQERYTFSST